MDVAVFGPGHFRGKEYRNYGYLCDILNGYDELTKIISGGGVGCERLATRYAADNDIPHEVVPPNIQAHGVAEAFVMRNQIIIKKVRCAIILWDGRDEKYHRLLAECVACQTAAHLYHAE